MKAVVIEDWTKPEDLNLGDLETPEPGTGEIRIKVAAAGVNFADSLMVQGKYQEKPAFPFAPGLECAGTVEKLGSDVTGLSLGQRVMALTDHGSYAEYALAKQSDVFLLPDEIDFVTAAGFPITYGTAHSALRWHGNLQAGETLVVHGAAGGVGVAAVEIGKAIGATVIATAGGADKLEIARQHGADHLIDYKEEDIKDRVKELTGGRGADVFFDPVGGKVFEASLRSAAWGARLLIIGFAAGEVQQIPANILLVKNVAAMGVYWGSYRKHDPERLRGEFDELFGWCLEGKLKPHVSHEVPLEEVRDALNLLLTRRSTGKVVLTL